MTQTPILNSNVSYDATLQMSFIKQFTVSGHTAVWQNLHFYENLNDGSQFINDTCRKSDNNYQYGFWKEI